MPVVSTTLKINTEGLDTAVKQSSQFNQNMQSGANALNSAKPSGSSAAGAMAAARTENNAYNIARGAGSGSTGSGASDFAAQSRGLGGLVRLYATFAANLYAASTAFKFLSEAVNTNHLVQGLDQLGAQSGKALGTLAKNLNAVTDGALSLKQSLTATAQASAAGITSAQILQMGEVAKKASQALGFDMANAMERLTKGIAKNSPELLDEIGILVNSTRVYADYARSVGKTANSLSDLEKKQAFANAVIKQGLEKFSAIDIPTNPYTKLEASLANVAQTGLSVLNTVLAPIAKFLADSPTGLATAIALIGSSLLKQAIPAIGEFRANAQKAAEEAGVLANTRSIAAKEAAMKQNKQLLAIAESHATAELDIVDKQAAQLQALRDKSTISKGSKAWKIIDKIPQDVTEADLRYLDKVADKLQKNNAIAAKGYREISESIAIQKFAEENYQKVVQDGVKELEKKSSFIGAIATQQRLADKANQEEVTRRIANTWAERTVTEGFLKATTQGWKELSEARKKSTKEFEVITKDSEGKDIKTKQIIDIPGISMLNAGVQGVVGTVKNAAAGVMNFASSLGNVFAVVGIGITAFSLLSSWLSQNTKEMEAFDTALASVKASAELADNVLDRIAKKSLDNVLSVESIMAKAKALDEMSSSLLKLTESLNSADIKANWFDKIIDGFLVPFGKDLKSKFASTTAEAISKGLNLITDSSTLKDTSDKLKQALNIGSLDYKTLQKALDKVDPKNIVEMGRTVDNIMKTASTSVSDTANKLGDFDEKAKAASTAFDVFIQSITQKDPKTKLGEALISEGNALQKAMKNPQDAIIALGDIIKDTNKLKMFSPEQQAQLVNYRNEIEKTKSLLGAYENTIITSQKELDKLEKPNTPTAKGMDMSATREYERKSAPLISNINEAEIGKNALLGSVKAAIEPLSKIFNDLKITGREMITAQLTEAQGRAGLAVDKAYLSGISGPGVATLNSELVQKELGLQAQLISVVERQIDAQLKSNYLLEVSNAQKTIELNTNTAAKINNPANMEIAAKAQKTLDVLTSVGDIISKGVAKFSPSLMDSKNRKGNASQEAQEYLQPMEQAFLGTATKRAEIAGKVAAEQINKEKGERAALLKLSQETKANEIDTKNVEYERLKIANSSTTYVIQDLLVSQQAKEVELERLNLDKVREANTARELEAQKLLDRVKTEGNSKSIKAATDALTANKQQSSFAETQLKNKQEIAQVNRTIALFQEQATRDKRELDYQNTLLGITNSRKNAELDADKLRLDYLNSISAITASNAIREQSAIDARKLGLDTEIQKQALLFTKESAMIDIRKNTNAALVAAPESAVQGILDDQLVQESKVNEVYKQRGELLDSQLNIKLKYLKLTEEEKTRLADQNEAMNKLISSTTSLAAIFGTVGDNIGKALQALQALGNTQTNNAISVKNAEEELLRIKEKQIAVSMTGSNDEIKKGLDEQASAEKNVSKVRQNAQRDELTGIASVANASKKLFNEKTVAYKALDALEKATHTYKLIMDNKEMISDVLKTGVSIAQSIARMSATTAEAGVDGIAAVIKQALGGDVYTAIPRMIAMAAFVSTLLGSIGGKSVSAPGGSTAAEQQAAQGTGQSYVNGQLVANGGGALGDVGAKSTAVADSLALIQKNTYEGLSYSNNMLSALLAIKDNTESLSKSIITIPGLTSQASSSSSSGFLGIGATSSTEIDRGFQLVNSNLSDLIKGVVNNASIYSTTQNKDSGFWGIGSSSSTSTSNSSIMDASVNKAIGAVFASANQALAAAAGTLGNTLFNSVVAGMDPVNFKISTLGLTGQQIADAIIAQVGIQMDIVANNAFPELSKFQQLGESLSTTVARVANDLTLVNQSFSLLGITMPKFVEVGTKASAAQLQTLATARTNLTKAQTDYENTSTTTSHSYGGDNTSYYDIVSKGNTQTIAALKAAQSQYDAIAKEVEKANTGISTNLYDYVENIIKLTGGIDEYVSKTKYFADNFVSSADVLSAKQKAFDTEVSSFASLKGIDTTTGLGVAKETTVELLKGLGVTSTMSRDTYAAAVKATAAMGATGQEAYAWLLNIGANFDTLTAKEKELSNTTKSLTDSLNNSSVALQKAKEGTGGDNTSSNKMKFDFGIENMSDAAIAIYKVNQGISDQTELQNKLATAYNNLDKATTDVLNASASLFAAQTANINSTYTHADVLATQRAIDIRGMSQEEAAIYDLNIAKKEDLTLINALVSAQNTLNATDKAVALQRASMQSLTGNVADALAEKRDIETKGMTDAQKALYDLNAQRSVELTFLQAVAAEKTKANASNVFATANIASKQGQQLSNAFSFLNVPVPKSLTELSDLIDSLSTSSPVLAASLTALEPLFMSFQASLTGLADTLGVSADGIKNIFKQVNSEAKNAEEAATLGAQKFKDNVIGGIQDTMLSGLSKMVSDAIMPTLLSGLTQASTVASVNLVTGGASAGTSMATGGAVGGAAVETGGINAGALLASATSYLNGFITLLSDPGFQDLINKLAKAVGGVAGAQYTATSVVNSTYGTTGPGGVDSNAASSLSSAYDSLEKQKRTQEISILRATGKEMEALAAEASDATVGFDALHRAMYAQVQANADYLIVLDKVKSLTDSYKNSEVALLKARGKNTEANALQEKLDLADVIAMKEKAQAILSGSDTAQARATQEQIISTANARIDAFKKAAATSGDYIDNAGLKQYLTDLQTITAAQAKLANLGLGEATKATQEQIISQANLAIKTYEANRAIAREAELVAKRTDLQSQYNAIMFSDEQNQILERNKLLSEINDDPIATALQKAVFAAQDLQSAEDKVTAARQVAITALNSDTTAMKSFIISIQTLKNNLKLSDLSDLTPEQKYAEARRQYLDVVNVLNSSSSTMDQKSTAFGQLDSVSNAFLSASKVFNASSQLYSDDFKSVTDSLDALESSYQKQFDDAEVQRKAQQALIDATGTNTSATVDATTAMKLLQEAIANLDLVKQTTGLTETKANSGAEITAAYQQYLGRNPDSAGLAYYLSMASTSSAIDSIKNSPEAQIRSLYENLLKREPDKAGLEYWVNTKMPIDQIADRLKQSDEYKNLPAHALGGLGRGVSVVGELGPEVVDFKTPGRVYTAEQTFGMFNGGNSSNRELVTEVRSLKAEVTKLREQQRTETGHMIEAAFEAQSENAKKITDDNKALAERQAWKNKLNAKATLV